MTVFHPAADVAPRATSRTFCGRAVSGGRHLIQSFSLEGAPVSAAATTSSRAGGRSWGAAAAFHVAVARAVGRSAVVVLGRCRSGAGEERVRGQREVVRCCGSRQSLRHGLSEAAEV